MGILLVYDVTDEASFNNIRNWMRNIEQHASDNVNKVGPAELYYFYYNAQAGPNTGSHATPLYHGWYSPALRKLMDVPPVQVLVGNKCDMEESKRKVPYSQGQALADEFGIQFFETSAKNNIKVDEVYRGTLPSEALLGRTPPSLKCLR